ncbi:MAG: bifunctional adenosylcobinamide kinase/adenosylcobinamide-phosphate guanylyltransferase [Hyphomicrobium sp.]|nr:bifunctional adenosylcobinamide kinase/adenosylcobinamide-phosphate guanylyltransferase [Hyphomicrobium sp.]MBN9276650.1 bifunctional adenosylcobinamide kinase/adenosylcobinamide-phosphate guanylyltransferase [Hyphomicrobium sp.]OJU23563.1 MAG: bifunctional adenosylcobinamide kinase/adenosylcobinamide-phosphate guanylyltransferase [Alphaproteobacteria bacterium 64-6]
MSKHHRLTIVLGGARSGKSRYAESIVSELPSPWIYVATGEALDDEMRERIAHHRGRRDDRWQTVDAPRDLPEVLQSLEHLRRPILVDCLTLWLSNCLLADLDLDAASNRLVAALEKAPGPLVVVSNEVGFGIVPETPLGRRFRDEQGRLNQRVAQIADRAVLVVAGLPLLLK